MTDLTDERLAEWAEIAQSDLDEGYYANWDTHTNRVLTLITALREERAEVERLQERVRVLEADVERRRLGKKVEDWPDWMQKASKIEGTPVLRHEIAALQQKENTDHE